jgi:hypothetical protein
VGKDDSAKLAPVITKPTNTWRSEDIDTQPGIELAVQRAVWDYIINSPDHLPINSEKALLKEIKALHDVRAPADWAASILEAKCTEWHGLKSSSARRYVERRYRSLDLIKTLRLDEHRITPTPARWVEPHDIVPRSWLYAPSYIRKFISLTAATGGTGKTSLGLVENAAMVTGRPLLGVEPGERDLRCWYWNGEDPLDEMQRRWVAVILHYGLSRRELDGRFFLDSGRDMPIKLAILADGEGTISAPAVDDLIYAIRHHKIDVLNIDPFVSSHSVTENDTAAIQAVAETWAHIANQTKCSIHLWHHTRKTRGADATIEDSRGASALIGAARGRRVLNKMTSEEARNAGLAVEERGSYFWGDTSLSSMVRPAEHREWFKLESVNLGNGDLGDGDEVGVAVAWEHPATSALDLSDDQEEAVFEAIKAGGPWRSNMQAENWIGEPIAEALELDPSVKADRQRVAKLIQRWDESFRLERYSDYDKHRNIREFMRATEGTGE